MNVLIAVDSFKGTLSSLQAGRIIERAFCDNMAGVSTRVVAVADGGEGTVAALTEHFKGTLRQVTVQDPLGRPVVASYGLCGDFAVIEMAEASGITLLQPGELDPLATSTFGTGQMILDALGQGVRRIILGIGGSATNDGGAGMLQALGLSLRDGQGMEIGPGGAALAHCHSIHTGGLDPRLMECEIVVACDVKNPLCGKHGASAVYGPQKGASPEAVRLLDDALAHWAGLSEKLLGRDYADHAGAGAAGGLGFALLAFCGAVVKPGIDVVLEQIGIDDILRQSDLLITGEGSIDAQTACGKVPIGLARYAKKRHVPVIVIAGQAKSGYEAVFDLGIDAVFACVNRIMDFEEASEESEKNLYYAAKSVARLLQVKAT